MEILILDIWLSKLNYGWKKEVKEALEHILHKDYEKNIKHSKEGALQLIADIALDYDGYNTTHKLKWLIDEIRAIALLGLKQKA